MRPVLEILLSITPTDSYTLEGIPIESVSSKYFQDEILTKINKEELNECFLASGHFIYHITHKQLIKIYNIKDPVPTLNFIL